MSRARHSQGFTLVELMVALTLLSVLAFVAIPSFVSFTRGNQVQAKAEELKDFLVTARTEALNTRSPIKVEFKANVWEMRNDQNVLRILEIPEQPKVTVLDSLTALTYTSNGTAALSDGAARFTVCHSLNTEAGYMVSVLPSGVARLHPKGRNDSNAALSNCE